MSRRAGGLGVRSSWSRLMKCLISFQAHSFLSYAHAVGTLSASFQIDNSLRRGAPCCRPLCSAWQLEPGKVH